LYAVPAQICGADAAILTGHGNGTARHGPIGTACGVRWQV
jgi:hypothetical protein